MPSEPAEPSPREPVSAAGPNLEDVLDRYLEELAAGRQPDQAAYLAAYPALADALRGVFKTLDFIETTSKSLDATRLERGQQLGDFRIVREVARGGMGVVYEAYQTSLNRRVALKVLPMGALLSPNAAERFAREAATAGRLHHTSIVPVYAVGEEQGIHYYAMQYIEGRSLAEHLKRLRASGAPPGRDYIRRVARWGQQVAEALACAHNENTIHRDIKPSNLLLDARDNVWVTDFGLARMDTHATLTITGDVVGTARYMSPEQARGGRTTVDHRTDIYSLGATLYELLTLTPAFDAESREEVLNRIAFADPPPVRRLNSAVPRDLETIVLKCMSKDPANRYARAEDVAEDCRRYLAHEPIRARRTPLVVKALRLARRHPVQSLGLTSVLGLSTVLLLLALHIRGEQGRRALADAYTALLFEQDYQRGEQLLDVAAGWGVHTMEVDLYRGLSRLLRRQPQEAIPHLHAALRRARDHVDANLALGLAYMQMGDYHNRARVLQCAPPERIETELGWLLYGLSESNTRRSEAIDSYTRAVAVRPDFTPAIAARARCRGYRMLSEDRREELNPMLSDCEALVVFRPNSALSYDERANGWLAAAAFAATKPDLRAYRQRWLDNCAADLEQACRLRRPNDSVPLVTLGVYRHYIGDYRGAEAAFAEAIAVDLTATGTTDPALIHKHSVARWVLGDPQGALSEIEPYCRSAPSFYPLWLEQVLLLAELGRLDEARAVGRALSETQRTHANAIFLAIVVLELVGDWSAAAEVTADLVARGPGEITSEDANDITVGPGIAFLSGQLDDEGLLAAASSPAPRAEYAFLVAVRRLAHGDRAGARRAFQECLNMQILKFLEHRLAQVMLELMESDPAWPAWVAPRDKSGAAVRPTGD